MTIIDLRPYEKNPGPKGLAGLIIDHYKTIRGVTQIIYDLPDEIWVTHSQSKQLEDNVWISHQVIPIKIKPYE